MFGIGVSELIVILIIALVLFGTPVLTFMLGYTMGRRAPMKSEQVGPAEASHDEGQEPTHE